MARTDDRALALVPPDIAQRVARRERRRARGVKAAVALGSLLILAGVALAAGAGQASPPLALALMAVGFCIAFPVAALLALVLGPTWEQRQQHYAWLRAERNWARHLPPTSPVDR